jgi:hypothetical protein
MKSRLEREDAEEEDQRDGDRSPGRAAHEPDGGEDRDEGGGLAGTGVGCRLRRRSAIDGLGGSYGGVDGRGLAERQRRPRPFVRP